MCQWYDRCFFFFFFFFIKLVSRLRKFDIRLCDIRCWLCKQKYLPTYHIIRLHISTTVSRSLKSAVTLRPICWCLWVILSTQWRRILVRADLRSFVYPMYAEPAREVWEAAANTSYLPASNGCLLQRPAQILSYCTLRYLNEILDKFSS